MWPSNPTTLLEFILTDTNLVYGFVNSKFVVMLSLNSVFPVRPSLPRYPN